MPFYLLGCLQSSAQALHYSSIPFTGSGVYNHRFGDAFSWLSNEAGLAYIPQATVGLYSEQKFGLKELSHHTLSAVLPVKGGGAGLALQYAGFIAFRQSHVLLGYGKQLGRVGLGVQFHYHHFQAQGYDSDGAGGFSISSIWPLTKKLVAGVQVTNPVGGKFRHSQQKLAALYRVGGEYEASEQVLISTHIIKEEGRPLNVLASLHYQLAPGKLFIRLGIHTATASPFICTGYQRRQLRLVGIMHYHPQLGLSPGLQLLLLGKQKQAD